MPSLGGYQPFLGGKFCLGVVATPWVWARLLKKGFSLPKEVRPHAQRLVTNIKIVHENINFYFHSTSMFVKYLGNKNCLGIELE